MSPCMCGGCPACGFPDAEPSEADLEDVAHLQVIHAESEAADPIA